MEDERKGEQGTKKLPVGSVKNDSGEATSHGTNGGDGEDPSGNDPSQSFPVERFDISVAKSNSESSSGDAHGRGDGKSVLRSEENGNGGSELHAESSRGRVESESVSEDSHDVVSVGSQSEDDHGSSESEDPDGSLSLGGQGSSGFPNGVDGRVRTDSVGDIVSSVSEGSSAGGENLEEGVEVLGLVGVLLSGRVHSLESRDLGLGSSFGLEGVNVDRGSVSQSSQDLVSKDDLEVILRPPVLLGIELRGILGLNFSKRDGVSRGVRLGGLFDVLLLNVLVGVNFIGGRAGKDRIVRSVVVVVVDSIVGHVSSRS